LSDSVPFGRKEDLKLERMTKRQAYGHKAIALCEREFMALIHRGHINTLAAFHIKGCRFSCGGLERFSPRRFETDGVHQNQSGQLVQRVFGNEITDALSGLSFYPGIDLPGGQRRFFFEIHRLERCGVAVIKETQEGLTESITGLAEKAVGYGQDERIVSCGVLALALGGFRTPPHHLLERFAQGGE